MTRFGFLLFNALLAALIYLLVYLGGAKPATIGYVLRGFSEPYIALILIMVVISTVRWFMSHDPDIAREVTTWVISLFFVPLLTVAALYLLGGIDLDHFGGSLHSLLTAR